MEMAALAAIFVSGGVHATAAVAQIQHIKGKRSGIAHPHNFSLHVIKLSWKHCWWIRDWPNGRSTPFGKVKR
jgi:hypothetical protein